jgi:hypothetical protein
MTRNRDGVQKAAAMDVWGALPPPAAAEDAAEA